MADFSELYTAAQLAAMGPSQIDSALPTILYHLQTNGAEFARRFDGTLELTSYATLVALQAADAPAAASLAYVIDEAALYVYDGAAWGLVAPAAEAGALPSYADLVTLQGWTPSGPTLAYVVAESALYVFDPFLLSWREAVPAAAAAGLPAVYPPRAAVPDAADFTTAQFGATDGVPVLTNVGDDGNGGHVAMRIVMPVSTTDYGFARVALPAATAGIGQTYRARFGMVGMAADIDQVSAARAMLCMVMGVTNADQWFGAGLDSNAVPDVWVPGGASGGNWATTLAGNLAAAGPWFEFTVWLHRYNNGGTWTLKAWLSNGSGSFIPLDTWTTGVSGVAGLVGAKVKTGGVPHYCILHEFGAVSMSGEPAFPDGDP